MGKIVQRFLRVFIMVLMIMSIPFFFKSSVSAATIQVNGLNGDQAIITDSSGKTVSDTQGLNEYNYYQVKYNWSIPDSVIIKSGDTAQFTLPSNIRVRSTEAFNITDSQGQVVGRATIKAGSSTGTIAFTNVPSTFRYDRHGTLTFYGQGKTVPKTNVNSWMINKGGWVDNKTLDSKGNPTQLYWNVVLNPAGKKLTGVSFTDKPQKGQTIISDSVEVYQVNSSNKLGKKLSPKITMNADGSMTIDLGDINTPIYIEYKVSLSKNVSNSATTEWKNVGIMNWNGGSSAHTTAFVRHGGSGTEVGYNGSVELHKVDAITKKSLAGAVFDLENQSGKVLQSNLTTDSNGNLIVKNLKDGNYQFVEVKAPQGYQINSNPIKFTINDSSSNAVSVKITAENQPLKSSPSKISSSSKKNSGVKSSSSKKSSSSVTASSSSKKSSSIKSSSNSNRVSSKQSSSSNSLVILTSSIKKNGSKSHRGVSGWSKNSSSNLSLSQKSSGLRNSTETSSKQGHFSIPNAKSSIESSEVPVEVSSQKATLVSSAIVVPVPEQGSSSRWTMSSKATLVSKTENVPTVSSSIVIVSKPNGTSNSENGDHGLNSSSASNETDSRLSKPAMFSTVVNNDNLNENNGASSSRSNQPSSPNVPAFQKAAVKSSSSSEVKKNEKILPQTGEEKEFMDVLSIVGLIMVGGVVGIEISKHRHN
ncbi:SpaA isopeptide-forming pilin-related protein [Ligilactobacillus aviarius]|uniref:SpaA isopeptide-forming pilin-related protein n=1 Tax=Ligilactobacillus aviarius TaxID=1606 RepID=UPI0025A4AF5F|nr:SpaA isopeptide-forming pilin-related protein [Ligilactobacillus aviarius]MDM8278037.1 SpaA isopeptide-forming pilin-related protein [Ligilactobacillus aviarius]